MSEYHQKCLRSVIAHAEVLQARAEDGQINESSIAGLMEGFLDQPCFYPEWRGDLLRSALDHLEGVG